MLLLSPLVNHVKNFLLRSFRHLRLLSCGKKRKTVGKVAAGKCVVDHDVEKMQQVVPLITRETAFC